MEFLPEKIEQYAEEHSSPESALLAALNRETRMKVLQPRMLSGHLQGRALAMLSKLKAPRYILEIGTYTGYSAICLAEGLAESGELHTIDINEELESMVRKYLKEAGLENKVQLHIGNALEIIPELAKPWELVFIDADKENYGHYYDLLIDKLPASALIIADNVLWSGKVTEPVKAKDEETRALIAFNEKVQADERVENLLLPLRDGLMIVRKR